jgi:Alkylmercury lyase
MTPFDRQVRAQIYRLLAGGAPTVDASVLADSRGWDTPEVEASLGRLAEGHVIALLDGSTRVWMAHPFSGIETSYQAVVADQSWYANCAWDALAILALLGDGEARATGAAGELVWKVEDGQVSPRGIVHLLVPAKNFWEDIGFT